MSIISCPECNRNRSSKTAICPFCGFESGEVTEADREVYRARKLRDRIYRLNMASYAVITVFVVGFGWFWLESGGYSQAPSYGPYTLMGISAVTYLVIRAMLFRCRQQRKAMREKRNLTKDLRRNL